MIPHHQNSHPSPGFCVSSCVGSACAPTAPGPNSECSKSPTPIAACHDRRRYDCKLGLDPETASFRYTTEITPTKWKSDVMYKESFWGTTRDWGQVLLR